MTPKAAENPERSSHVVIVIPVFNEGEPLIKSLRVILREAALAATRTGLHASILVVDDGSSDGTPARLAQHFELGSEIAYLRLARNCGKEVAILAGLCAAQDASAVVVMDGDLQHPPALLLPMFEAWLAGSDVVEACKSSRGKEGWFRGLGARLFYGLFRAATDLDIEHHSDFKLLDAKVVAVYVALPERKRFFRGLISWLQFPSMRVQFDVAEGARPASRWSSAHLLRYAVSSLVSFTSVPLQLVTWCGGLTFLVSLVFGGKAIYDKWTGHAADGFSTVILLLLLIASILMFSLGLIGLYVARIYDEVKQRPPYQIDLHNSRPWGHQRL